MQIWQSLSKIALLGTDRSKIAEELAQAFKSYKIDTSQNPSTQILEAAATLGTMRRAGYQLQQSDIKLESTLQNEDLEICSSKSCRHLASILKLAHEDSLKEFLTHLQNNQKTIAPEFLPELLEHGLRSKDLWPLLSPVIGQRGEWLAQQNPDWAHLQNKPIEVDWPSATTDAKLKLLGYWRRNDPAEAIEIIRFYWFDEKPNVKARLIKALETSLSLADEDFLEDALNEKRKEVRTAAANLLAKLEGSEYIDRMYARGKSFLSIKNSSEKGLKMEVNPFDDLDKSATRDGLSLQMQWQKEGSGIGIVYHILQCVPPFYWEKYFKVNKQQLLESYVRSDWSVLLVQACVDASTRFEDEKWMAILLNFWSENQHKSRWKDLDFSTLISKVPNALFNRISSHLMQQEVNLFEEKNLLIQLLNSKKHQWNSSLAKAFIRYLADATGSSHSYWTAQQFRTIIKNAAYRCPPKDYDILHRLLPETKLKWTVWEEDYNRFLKILKFRRDMILELEKKS